MLSNKLLRHDEDASTLAAANDSIQVPSEGTALWPESGDQPPSPLATWKRS